MLEPDTPEYLKMVEDVVDPKRGAEYLFKELLRGFRLCSTQASCVCVR